MQVANKINRALCPDCEMRIKVGPSPKIGEKLMCPHCEAYLEIVSLDPVELDWNLDGDDGDDWDEDEWDDDEDRY